MIAHELERELRVPSNLNVGALADAEPPLEPDALRAYIADEVDGEHVSIGRAKRGGFKKAASSSESIPMVRGASGRGLRGSRCPSPDTHRSKEGGGWRPSSWSLSDGGGRRYEKSRSWR